MAKKKASKKARKKSDDIGMAYHVEGPKGMSRAKVFTAMIESIRTGVRLPAGVKVTWKWRNSKKQGLRAAPMLTAVRKSRAGFLRLMEQRIVRDALKVPGFVPPPPLREATAKEIAAIERAENKSEEKRESAGHRKGGGTRQREAWEKRSAAARKGWETRRAKAAAEKPRGSKPAKGKKRK